jgi:rRNA biogenesis protein RRP5
VLTDHHHLRNLFDRILAQKMTSHKAKYVFFTSIIERLPILTWTLHTLRAFFKKWLALEKRIGDEAGAETVKAKAIEWTRRAAIHTTAAAEGDE